MKERPTNFIYKIKTFNEKYRKLSIKKRLKFTGTVLLKGIKFGLLCAIVPSIIVCAAIILMIRFNYQLPIIAIVWITLTFGLICAVVCILKFLPPEELTRILENIDK